MGRHSAPNKSRKKIAPSLVLGLSIFSGSSPIVAAVFTPSSMGDDGHVDPAGEITTASAPVSQSLTSVTSRKYRPSVVERQVKLAASTITSPSMSISGLRSSSPTVMASKRYVGMNLPYRYGGNSLKTGIDCSHFVWMVMKEAGYKGGYRSSSELARTVKRVSTPRPGDLVLYRGHVGIYAGNGMMIHHGRSGGAFYMKVYKQNFIGYGRI